MCQNQGQGPGFSKKKKKIIISQSNNGKQHKDEGATDRDQLKLTRPWLLSMT